MLKRAGFVAFSLLTSVWYSRRTSFITLFAPAAMAPLVFSHTYFAHGTAGVPDDGVDPWR